MKKSKLLAVVLVLAMTLSLLPTTALAAEGVTGCGESCDHVAAIGKTHYDTLQDAVDNVSNGQTIMLLQDVSNAQITVAGKGTIDQPVVLDLNGKTITGAEKKDALYVKSSAVLTVTDSSTNKDGQIMANGGNAIYVFSATANLNAGQYTATGDYTIYDYNSTLKISGGTFTQNDANYLIYLSGTNATANISDGTFIQNGAKNLIYINSGTANISGGSFTNHGNQMMLYTKNGKYNITGGTFNGGSADILADSIYYTVSDGQFSAPIPVDTVAAAGKTSASAAVEGYYGLVDLEDGAAPVTLTYKDGSAVDQTSYYASPYQALSAASDKTGAVVTVIKNVKTSRSLAPYGKAKLVVSQGTELRCSSITVSAGAFSGVSVENNGTIVTTGMIAGSMGSCKLVNNGIITCGGSFFADTAGWENNGKIAAAGNITLKSFSNDEDGVIVGASGKTMTVKDSGITMKSNSYPVGTYNWDATAGWVPGGKVTVMKNNNALAGYDSLSDAYNYAKENSADTLKLQGDIIQSGALVVPADKSITLDLNGHTISRGGQLSSKSIIDVSGTLTVKDSTAATVPVVNADGSVTYDSGAIQSTYSSDVIYVHNGGTFTLESGTIVGCEDYAAVKIANMNMADDRTAAEVGASNAVVNINGGLVRSEKGYGVAMFGTGTTNNPQATDPVLNVSGGVIISSNTTAIIGQGTYHNTKINISGGKIISPNAVAIYHPQYGAMTVTGGEITGASGIEMRAGTLSVSSDAKIAGTATTFVKQENGSGNTVLGAGIAVSQHTTNLPLSVTISETNDKAPTITGIYALYEEDLQDETGTDKIALNISGGNFVGTGSTAIFSENVAKFITGGTFSSDPSAYVAANGTNNIVKRSGSEGSYTYTVMAKANLTDGVYLTDPYGATAPYYYVTNNNNGTWTVYYSAPSYGDGGSSTTTPSQPTTSTETKPDGSTTTTESKPDGTVTESNTSKPVTDASGNTSQTTTETTTGKEGVTESKTETVTKPDGSASSTTESTTTKPDGTKTESTTETTVNKDGSTASTTTATTTNKDGTVTESKTEATTSTVTNKDGSTTETKQETTTTSTGSKTESTTVTTTNKDGSSTATTTATTTDKAGTVTESKTESTTSKNGTTTEVTVTTETKANGTVIESKTATTTQTNGSSSSTTTATTTKADGTTTTSKTTATTSLSTNKTTGTVTETKKETTTTSDGVKSEGTTVTQIRKDGTVTSTETVKASDSTGTTATKTTTLDAKGEVTTTAEVSVSSKAVTKAAKTGVAVTIPVEVTATKSASTAPTVSVSVPKTAESVKVELPVQNVTPGTVAVIVNADGTEKIVSTSMVTENGVALKLDGSATVKLVDNAKSFTDVPETNVFYNEISSLSARNIMIGVSNEKFDLHNSVTLDQVANVAGRITGAVDVKDFNAGVAWGQANGLKTGNVAATRGDVLKALYIAAGSPAVEDTSILTKFKDGANIPADMAAIAAWAAQNGILKGNMDGTAGLSNNVTRGQACALAGRTMGTLA